MIAHTASGSSLIHGCGCSSGERMISIVPSASIVTSRSLTDPTMRSEYRPSFGPP